MKILSKVKYIRNTSHTLTYSKNIRNADMNELSEMPAVALGSFLNTNTYISIQVNKR